MAEDAFEALATVLEVGPVTKPAHPTQPQRMNRTSFCIRNRVFAIRIGSDLVLKLSPSRVSELVTSGIGRPHLVGGRQMRDRVVIPADQAGQWPVLGRESLEYTRGA